MYKNINEIVEVNLRKELTESYVFTDDEQLNRYKNKLAKENIERSRRSKPLAPVKLPKGAKRVLVRIDGVAAGLLHTLAVKNGWKSDFTEDRFDGMMYYAVVIDIKNRHLISIAQYGKEWYKEDEAGTPFVTDFGDMLDIVAKG